MGALECPLGGYVTVLNAHCRSVVYSKGICCHRLLGGLLRNQRLSSATAVGYPLLCPGATILMWIVGTCQHRRRTVSLRHRDVICSLASCSDPCEVYFTRDPGIRGGWFSSPIRIQS